MDKISQIEQGLNTAFVDAHARSNLRNKEWNTRLVSTEHGEYAQQIMDEYNLLWNSKYCERFEEFIDKYRIKYKLTKEQKKIARQTEIPDLAQYRLQPNKMQVEFVRNLKELRMYI